MELSKICKYTTSRIDSASLNVDNYISTENMMQNRGGVISASKVPPEKAVEFMPGDILLSNIRPYFKKIWLADRSGGCSSDVLCIRALEGTDSVYLYYLLSRDSFFDYVMSGAKGSKMPRGDKNQIMKWEVDLPEINEQYRIGQMLKSIDDKILLNNRINHNLEEQAKALYKSWFEDNSDCENWPNTTLSAFFNVLTGKKDANFSSPDGPYPFFTCSQEPLRAPSYSFEGKAILMAGNGDFNVKRFIGKFEAYQRTYVLMPFEDKYQSFLYLLMSLHLGDITGGSRGSVIKFITKGSIADYSFRFPPYCIDDKLAVLNSIYAQVDEHNAEIEHLSTLRDRLLPQLISGDYCC